MAPALISVVVPVYGVRQYLGECLDSVLGEPTDVEVIAVDDASPDGSGELLDERARADSRLRVVHLDRNGGRGNARNIGLASARGQYVWFVDGDDKLPPGAISAVSARLARDQPDVLLIDYAEFRSAGQSRPSTGGALLRAAPQGSFSLAQQPQLVNLTMTSWSKLLRREFLIALDEPFRPGIHEDIPVTCAALFAGRLSALGEVCYLYRTGRPGAAMSSSAGQDAVFGAYHEVLQKLAKLTEAGDQVATPAVRSAVFERAIWHYAAVLGTTGPGIGPVGAGGLVRRADRKRFFSRMHADFIGYQPDGYQFPSGPRGAKLRLIQRNAYLTYELLEPLNRLRVAARRAVGNGLVTRPSSGR